MSEQDLNQRLSQIRTMWSDVLNAKDGPAASPDAQQRLLQRYGGAVHRYLLGAVRDGDAADDLFQEFALRFLRGDFKRVDPERGRFRNFLKTAVLNLVNDHRRRQKTRPQAIAPDAPEPAAPFQSTPDLDREFLSGWREELLTRSWDALAAAQQQTEQPIYSILRFRAEFPGLDYTQFAEQFGQRLGKPLTANYARQLIYRARKAFADFLLEEVVQSLAQPTADEVLEELTDLGLLEFCKPALDRV